MSTTTITDTRRALAILTAYRNHDRDGIHAVTHQVSEDPQASAALLVALLEVCSSLLTECAGMYGDQLLANLADMYERQRQAGNN